MGIFEFDAISLASKVRQGQLTASAVVKAVLDRVRNENSRINAFTLIMERRAIEDARRIDDLLRSGRDPGQLAGVPFAAKNLFDIADVTTIAGSAIRQSNPAARDDATIIRRLTEA